MMRVTVDVGFQVLPEVKRGRNDTMHGHAPSYIYEVVYTFLMLTKPDRVDFCRHHKRWLVFSQLEVEQYCAKPIHKRRTHCPSRQ